MQEEKKYFPLFVSLEGKKVFIAGAGKIAARRAKVLLSFGAELWIAAPEYSREMEELLKEEACAPPHFPKRTCGEMGETGVFLREKGESGEDSKESEDGKDSKDSKESKDGRDSKDSKEGENSPGRLLHCRKGKYREEDLQDKDLVLAATDDAALNHRIAEACRERGIPVNNASDRADCDFFFPAVIQEERLTIGVSSGGRDHKKVAEVCEKLRHFLETSL